MTDDSEMVDDKETALAAVTDDSCIMKFIEIVPLDRPADDYCKPEFIEPVVVLKPEDLQDLKHISTGYYCEPQFIERVVEVKPEDLQDVKQEPADDSNVCMKTPSKSLQHINHMLLPIDDSNNHDHITNHKFISSAGM